MATIELDRASPRGISAQRHLTWALMEVPEDVDPVLGVTDILAVHYAGEITVSYTVANINTNVTVRLEASIDGAVTFFNANPGGTDITITSNGTFPIRYVGRITHARFVFVDETAGTTATIAPKALVCSSAG